MGKKPDLISKSDLDRLMAEVEAEMATLLKSEALAKSDDEEEGGEGGGDEGGAEASAGGPPPAAADAASSAPPAEASAAPGGDAPPGDAPPGDAPPADSAPPADPAAADAGGPMDLQSLTAEYSKLAAEDGVQALKLHFLAASAALKAAGVGGGADAGAGAGGPPPGAASAPPGAGAPPAMKSEMGAAAPTALTPPVAKSEADALKNLLAQQEKKIELLVKAVETLSAPQRKAVTGVSQVQFLNKGEDKSSSDALPSRAEALAVLSEKAKSPSLAKSDRDLINSFCVGTKSVTDVVHLLK